MDVVLYATILSAAVLLTIAWLCVRFLLNDAEGRALEVQLGYEPQENWPRIEKNLRKQQCGYRYDSFDSALLKQPKLINSYYRGSEFALGFLSFSPNGYLREKATRELADIYTGSELPFLLLRCCDWVEQVRAVAVESVETRLDNNYVSHFLSYAGLIAHLKKRQGRDVEILLARVESLLLREASPEQFATTFLHADTKARRYLAKLLQSSDSQLPADQLISLMLQSKDPIIRLISVSRIRQTLSREAAVRTLLKLTSDSANIVRRAALREFEGLNLCEARPVWEAGLLDPSAKVRRAARELLAKHTDFGVRSFYRQHLTAELPKTRKVALLGLAEVGTAEDTSAISEMVSEPSPGIRSAAVFALAQLDGISHVSVFLTALMDDSPSVRRSAARAVSQNRGLFSAEDLLLKYREASDDAKPQIVSLARQLPKWDSVICLLQMLSDCNQTGCKSLTDALRLWMDNFNHNMTPPSNLQVRQLHELLDGATGHLNPAMQKSLRFYIS